MADLNELSFMMWLQSQGYSSLRPIGNNRWAGLFRFMFTDAIMMGDIGDMLQVGDRYCYHDRQTSEAALAAWEKANYEGEPQGWHRHPATGRRREDGDPEREAVRF